jgi:uncharacterized protein YndB with AHSA1/START domain
MTYHFRVTETVRLPAEEIFKRVADHERLGAALGAPLKRTKDGQGDINGLGSVRTIGFWPMEVDETITAFEPPHRIEYRITRGSPMRNYRGNIVFSGYGPSTEVTWTGEFDTSVPLLGSLVKRVLGFGIGMAVRKLGRQA